MISESVFLFQDDSGVRRHVSEGGRGLRPPRHDEKGNDGIENITDFDPKETLFSYVFAWHFVNSQDCDPFRGQSVPLMTVPESEDV